MKQVHHNSEKALEPSNGFFRSFVLVHLLMLKCFRDVEMSKRFKNRTFGSTLAIFFWLKARWRQQSCYSSNLRTRIPSDGTPSSEFTSEFWFFFIKIIFPQNKIHIPWCKSHNPNYPNYRLHYFTESCISHNDTYFHLFTHYFKNTISHLDLGSSQC